MAAPSLPAPALQEQIAGWLSPTEFHCIECICDTFLPALTPPEGSFAALASYYQRNAHDLHIPLLVAETLARESVQTQADVRQLLKVFASPFTGLLLIGVARPFVELVQEQRERYLLGLAKSPIARLRQGYQAFKRLTGFLFFSVPDRQGDNPNWQVLDYTPPALSSNTLPRLISPLDIQEDTVLECDAVVIGSGAGGGVAAGELTDAGKSVIVLEKGGYFAEENFTLREAEAMRDLYLKNGTLATKDQGVIILAGSTLGGGTVVNWCTSFRTPENVLEEWTKRSGISAFTDSPLQDSFAAVERRISVNTANSAHNKQNQLLFDGATALGYHAGSLRRNAQGCEQRCGTCGFGCRYGCKQSTMRTYLQDAYDAGARIIVRCSADRVLIQNDRAVGVEARVNDPQTGRSARVTVRAKVVICAAGSIHSPAVLLRSRIENAHIGQHLYLHPTSTIGATYREKVYPWQGVMQSAYCDEFARLHGNYGYKLEVAPAHPGLLGLGTAWYGARDYRERMANAAFSSTIIVLTRDCGSGSITLDRAGEPLVNYVPSAFDRAHLLHGLRRAARVHFAAGAQEIVSLHSKPTKLARRADGTVSTRDLSSFDAQLERHGMGPNRLIIFSAHQMGTCRMGADPAKSVTDSNCEVHNVKGLFVCDGSVFPASSGVNPMLSIMALAHQASQYIKTVL